MKKKYVLMIISEAIIIKYWDYDVPNDIEFGKKVKENEEILDIIGEYYYNNDRAEYCEYIGQEINKLSYDMYHSLPDKDDVRRIFNSCVDKDIRKEICGQAGVCDGYESPTYISVLLLDKE